MRKHAIHWSVTTGLGLALSLALGCGTTRMTDTQRTATEQLLISNAIDHAISEIDVRSLAGKTVYFDPQYLEGCVDRGYLISSIRQHLLANGCILQEDRSKALYVVEARTGGVGTDRHSLLVGIPPMAIPSVVPGLPAQIPEIPFAKKTDQHGIAKIAVYAYNRMTGRPIWQSGIVESQSTAQDSWFLGAGPFQKGTIRHGTVFAGQPIPLLTHADKDDEGAADRLVIPVTRAATWLEPAQPPRRVTELMGAAFLGHPLLVSTSLEVQLADPAWVQGLNKPAAPAPKPNVFTAAPTPNSGGQAETEPAKVLSTWAAIKPDS